MAPDDNETDQEPRASRPSDPAAEAASPADDRSTFIGLGVLSVPPSRPEGAAQDAPSSVPSEGAAGDGERTKTPEAAPALESNDESKSVEAERATSRSEPPSKKEPTSEKEPTAAAEAGPTSDRSGAAKAEPKMPETEQSASSDEVAEQPRTSTGSGVALKATRKRAGDTNGDERRAASAEHASREPKAASPGSGGALLVVLALGGVVLVGGWWMLNRESNPSEKVDAPTAQQDPPAPVTETKAVEHTAESPTQPLPPPVQPLDDQVDRTSTEPGTAVPSGAPVGDALEDEGAEKGASAQRKPRTAALVAISKDSTKMRNCRRKPDPAGTAQVRVTFDSSGRVSKVRVLPPYAATHTGVCLTERLKQITMDPFSGGSLTVQAAIPLY